MTQPKCRFCGIRPAETTITPPVFPGQTFHICKVCDRQMKDEVQSAIDRMHNIPLKTVVIE